MKANMMMHAKPSKRDVWLGRTKESSRTSNRKPHYKIWKVSEVERSILKRHSYTK